MKRSITFCNSIGLFIHCTNLGWTKKNLNCCYTGYIVLFSKISVQIQILSSSKKNKNRKQQQKKKTMNETIGITGK